MYNRRFIVTLVELNTGNDKEIKDVHFTETVDSANGKSIYVYYPTELQIINDTGMEIEIIFFHDRLMRKDYDDNPDNHTRIRVPNNFVLQDDIALRGGIETIIVKGNILTGTATKNLIIEMIDYKRFKR